MIDVKSGRLVLCKSEFIISSEVCPDDIEEKIPELIAYSYTVDSGWSHYYCWFDIEDGEYIYASLSFCGDRLDSICLQPQYSASAPKEQPNLSDVSMDFEGIRAWHQRYFALEKQTFPWGKVALCRETDPIYNPTRLIIKYK